MRCATCDAELIPGPARVRGTVAIALYAAALAAAYTLGGDLLHDLAEGMDRARLALWKLAPPILLVIAAIVAWRGRFTRPSCARCGTAAPDGVFTPVPDADRRRVLRALGTSGAAVAATAGGVAAAVGRNAGWLPVARDFFTATVEKEAPTQRPEWGNSYVRAYRRLGRTGVEVSDISVGCGQLENAAVARDALERGVTYFDTSPDYADARSELAVGEALKGHRDKVFIATKFCRPTGHLPDDTPVPEIIATVEASLKRLQTDYVDLIHVHSCDRVDRLMAPNIHEAFDRLKEQGKVRFLGVSTHTPNLEAVANAAIDSKRFDVMMLAYHFGMWPTFGHIVEKAHAADVGVVAMKTLKGAKHTNLAAFQDQQHTYSHAAFRWVLSNPAVSCLVVSFKQPQHVNEYLAASGTELHPRDTALLERYDQLTAGDYCQPHCGLCLDKCPEQLAINDVLRWRMYFRDYGWEKEGLRHYVALDRDASACVSCPAPCAGACPIGVPIREKMLNAHDLLRLGA